MLDLWVYDVDALRAVTEDEEARTVIRRLGALARAGRLRSFVAAVEADRDLDEETRVCALELARSEPFLLAAEQYVARFRDVN